MGKCSEPTNVRAGGQACPIRYQCAGCPHFESDPSYLPELRGYANELRQSPDGCSGHRGGDEMIVVAVGAWSPWFLGASSPFKVWCGTRGIGECRFEHEPQILVRPWFPSDGP
jgi:hypothetical protein